MPWYQSTQGPQISRTIIYVVTMVILPMLQELFGVNLDGHLIGAIIELVILGVFGFLAIKSHVKAKNILVGRMGSMKYRK